MEQVKFTSVQEIRANAQKHIGKLALVVEFAATLSPQYEGDADIFYRTTQSHLGIICEEKKKDFGESIPAAEYVSIVAAQRARRQQRTLLNEGNMPLDVNVHHDEIQTYRELESDWSMLAAMGDEVKFTGIRFLTERPLIDAYFTIGDALWNHLDAIMVGVENETVLEHSVRNAGLHSIDLTYGTALRKLRLPVPDLFKTSYWKGAALIWRDVRRDLEHHANHSLEPNRSLLERLETSGIGRSDENMTIGNQRVPVRDYVEALRVLSGYASPITESDS